ncbi:MAG: arginine deiminase family protein, partial [Nitriliruptorales bacterium]
MDVGVRSEVGRLRTVLVHRPDLELRRLTPGNMDELLFDELLWVDRAQEEHDAFVAVLRGTGAEVLHVGQLLADVLADRSVVDGVVATLVNERTCGPILLDRVRGFLLDLPTPELVRHLIGGVSFEEVAGGALPAREPEGLVARAHGPWELLLQPLPNTVFTRDSSAWIGDGVVISPMNRLVRRREAQLLRLVYELHPTFAGARFWYGDEPIEYFPATFEGGDLLVVGERGIAVGMSERTTPQGVEALAARLFANGLVDRIVAVDLPKTRSTMHLDTVVTMVDRDAFVLF